MGQTQAVFSKNQLEDSGSAEFIINNEQDQISYKPQSIQISQKEAANGAQVVEITTTTTKTVTKQIKKVNDNEPLEQEEEKKSSLKV